MGLFRRHFAPGKCLFIAKQATTATYLPSPLASVIGGNLLFWVFFLFSFSFSFVLFFFFPFFPRLLDYLG